MPLRYETEGDIAVFTIDNGAVNPMRPAMHKELHAALTAFLRDKNVRCGILTGAGDRAFCAGDDIRTPRRDATPAEQFADHLWPHSTEGDAPHDFSWSRDVLGIERHKPIIGAVNGWCLGMGLIYLLALTDIRIAGSGARFGFPEIAYGMGGAGGTTRLLRNLPPTVAMWMLLTGEAMTAAEAERVFLVNRVVEPGDVMAEARAVAQRIARHPPAAVRVEMEATYRAQDLGRADAIAFTKHLYRLQRLGLAGGGDGLEGGFLYGRQAGNPAPRDAVPTDTEADKP
jgi:enoyl-CoA hydratase/carnithine racemase